MLATLLGHSSVRSASLRFATAAPTTIRMGIPVTLRSPMLRVATPIPTLFAARTAVSDLRPRVNKRTKSFKGFFKTRSGGSLKGTTCYRGDFGLRAVDGGRITDLQMENCLLVIRRVLKDTKGSKVYRRLTASRAVSKKPLQTRMGKGKGDIDHYACWVSPGRVMFEVRGLSSGEAKRALAAAASCLPVRSKIIRADDTRRRNPTVLPHFIRKRIETNELRMPLPV